MYHEVQTASTDQPSVGWSSSYPTPFTLDGDALIIDTKQMVVGNLYPEPRAPWLLWKWDGEALSLYEQRSLWRDVKAITRWFLRR